MPKKILVVDDEPQIVHLLSARLKASGYDTYGANDSYQCIKMTKEVNPDLILLDMKMPAGGGIQAFNNLKSYFTLLAMTCKALVSFGKQDPP